MPTPWATASSFLDRKLGQLGPSTTREVEHIEKEDERAVFLQRLPERQLLARRRGQLEVGRLVPHLQHADEFIGSPARTSRSASLPRSRSRGQALRPTRAAARCATRAQDPGRNVAARRYRLAPDI